MAIVLHTEVDRSHHRVTIELAVRKYRSNARTVREALDKIREALALAFPSNEE